jgi:serine/threonine-protein kinase RsbW
VKAGPEPEPAREQSIPPTDPGAPEKSTQPRSFSLGGERALALVRRSIRSDLGVLGAHSEDVFDCLVAVTEACSNALRHGRAEAAPRLSWTIRGRRVRFDIQDFSQVQWARPARDGAGDRAAASERIGGYGLELMKGLMDGVRIRRSPRGTIVELTKRLR